MMADGDIDEVTFTMIKSPVRSESPDLFSEELDINQSHSDKVKGFAQSKTISEKRDSEEGDFGRSVKAEDQSKGESMNSERDSAVGKVNTLSKIDVNTEIAGMIV